MKSKWSKNGFEIDAAALPLNTCAWEYIIL